MSNSTHRRIPAPKGTRDLFPEDFLRQRYITDAWRRVSIRHGFEEIAGPTFEMLDLYKKKSGEGIVSELFSFRRAGGDDDYALRPEFTPTLARMYAQKANALPNPCKWFTAGPYFRAEKPQRGRLREFLQWNCDVMGDESADADASIQSVVVELISDLGLTRKDCQIHSFHRKVWTLFLDAASIAEDQHGSWFGWIDHYPKLTPEARVQQALSFGATLEQITQVETLVKVAANLGQLDDDELTQEASDSESCAAIAAAVEMHSKVQDQVIQASEILNDIELVQRSKGMGGWAGWDSMIVRGLAYYTGTVFELIAGGERAVAGGGRYDNLIELFGGPPTPAVGFGMGDVVLGLLLEDKGLMPEGPELMDAVSQKPASLRPEAFVVAGEEHQDRIEPLLAQLRRGTESEAWKDRPGKPWDADRYDVPPMHARRSYKSTKNIGKLLADARKQHAKFAVIIESDEAAKVENLGTREDLGTHALADVGRVIAPHL